MFDANAGLGTADADAVALVRSSQMLQTFRLRWMRALLQPVQCQAKLARGCVWRPALGLLRLRRSLLGGGIVLQSSVAVFVVFFMKEWKSIGALLMRIWRLMEGWISSEENSEVTAAVAIRELVWVCLLHGRRLGGMLCRGIGGLCVVRAFVSQWVPWRLGGWILPDLHGFHMWIFDALGPLNDFVQQVVNNWRNSGLRRWASWLGYDLGARPFAWLRPDFFPTSPFPVIRESEAQTSRILVEPHLIDAEFRKAWILWLQYINFVGPYLPQEAELDLPGGLGGWAWNEVKALPLPWFSGLAILLSMVESTGGERGLEFWGAILALQAY